MPKPRLKPEAIELIQTGFKDVVCWPDSLTACWKFSLGFIYYKAARPINTLDRRLFEQELRRGYYKQLANLEIKGNSTRLYIISPPYFGTKESLQSLRNDIASVALPTLMWPEKCSQKAASVWCSFEVVRGDIEFKWSASFDETVCQTKHIEDFFDLSHDPNI